MFVPWGTVKVFKFISPNSRTDWLIYSPRMQWGYVTDTADQFTEYAEEFAGSSEQADVTREQFARVTAWDYSDGRRVEYSTKESMLVLHQGPFQQKPRVKNKLWIETWSERQEFKLTGEVEAETTSEERALVEGPDNQFSWGEFNRQEPLPPVSYVRIVLTLLFILLGILVGMWTNS